ncbi:hypothetical protein [Kushneria phosphatilytica]|uniref:hypothetical protein n=1 Tax=Kushneria phosphatilytica TaxID=657387 RepID=UPI00111308A6|nr:hypothetical protein [Kushneria phosphatilytica]
MDLDALQPEAQRFFCRIQLTTPGTGGLGDQFIMRTLDGQRLRLGVVADALVVMGDPKRADVQLLAGLAQPAVAGGVAITTGDGQKALCQSLGIMRVAVEHIFLAPLLAAQVTMVTRRTIGAGLLDCVHRVCSISCR